MSTYRGRIAPSPTGYLHLGHARTFWIAQQRAQAADGLLLLRNDDLDTQRARPEFARAMLEDLAWLGLHWQEAPYVQSKRTVLYRTAFRQLRESGAIYPCSCSRRDLQRSVQAPHAEDDDEPIYPGTCRNQIDVGGETAWRFRVPDNETITVEDENLGTQSFVAGRDVGDFIVMRRDGIASYQLACVVDDAEMRITEVVRGRDLLKSTAMQMLLQHALGYPTPAYFHTDLLLDDTGQRLAKRHDALSLRHLRESGVAPQEILERFAKEIA